MITVPAVSLAVVGWAGMIRSTYRSPNSVVGTISAVTFAGIWFTMPGWIASASRAPVPVAEICRTSPTWTPRIITSAPGCISLPTLSVYRVTVATGVNCLLYSATDSHTSRAKTSRNTTPMRRSLVFSCAADVIRRLARWSWRPRSPGS